MTGGTVMLAIALVLVLVLIVPAERRGETQSSRTIPDAETARPVVSGKAAAA